MSVVPVNDPPDLDIVDARTFNEREFDGGAQVIDNGGVRGYGETMPMVYQQVRTDAVHALRHKKAFIGDVGAVAQMRYTEKLGTYK